MTKKTLREYKAANQRRREAIISASHKKPLGENRLIWLGGVIQKGRKA